MCIFIRICEIIFLVGGPWKVLEKRLKFFCMNPVILYVIEPVSPSVRKVNTQMVMSCDVMQIKDVLLLGVRLNKFSNCIAVFLIRV